MSEQTLSDKKFRCGVISYAFKEENVNELAIMTAIDNWAYYNCSEYAKEKLKEKIREVLKINKRREK